MKDRWQVILLMFCCFSSVLAAPGPERKYNKTMFADGLRREGFVLINLRTPSSDSARTICTLSTLLEGALIIENHLDFGEKGTKQANKIALGQWNAPFVFLNPRAYRNVKPNYSEAQLQQTRRKLATASSSELEKRLRLQKGNLNESFGLPNNDAYSYAIAHVLLERGIPAAMGDWSGTLGPL